MGEFEQVILQVMLCIFGIHAWEIIPPNGKIFIFLCLSLYWTS